jgi:predicted ribosomally synthesized peptide with SipW-like signal peptide
MNKKIFGSIAAMVAVLALVAGGTFAAWTADVTVEDHTVTAGYLELDVTNNGSTTLTKINKGPVAPGYIAVWDWYIANSSQSPDFPVNLFFDLSNLADTTAIPPGLAGAGSALANEIEVRVRSQQTIAGACGGSAKVLTGWQSLSSLVAQGPLKIEHGTMAGPNNDVLQDGGSICVGFEWRFEPGNATNASQHGQFQFDTTFELKQDL